jgi:SAM-dependent methyltransferase
VDIDAVPETPREADLIDVRDLMARYSIDELIGAADDYYRNNLGSEPYWLAKPATNADEAVELLAGFAQILAGVRPLPGMRVLDFGAGTGWTSRFLTQLGCEVIVCDASPTALNIAAELFKRNPVAGAQPEPTFLVFDGHRIELADESVDRIICIDAFHHVPNPGDVLREFGRVLRSGGIAGFQEPGPDHSRLPQSQFEMKNYTVIENDIRIRDIQQWATAAGFSDVKLAVFTAHPFHVSIAEYEDYLARGVAADRFYEHQRVFVAGHRLFFLAKGAALQRDSRERIGLAGELTASSTDISSSVGETVRLRVTARNTGDAVWLLRPPTQIGTVNLGAHLYDGEGRLLERDHARVALPVPSSNATIEPGVEVSFDAELTMPSQPGSYVVELDLVSEGVAWFSVLDGQSVSVRLTVAS